MDAINNFSGGMNSDVSKQVHSKDSYIQALNFRGLTEIGSSNGSLVNVKGNECKITFPDLQPVYKIYLNKGTNTDAIGNSNIVTMTINGVTAVSTFNISNNTRGFDIYNFIISQFTECYQNTTSATKTFSVAYDDDYVVIYQQPIYQDCSPVSSIPTIITFTFSTLLTTNALLYFKNPKGTDGIAYDSTKLYVDGTISNNIIPIGSTFILNDIYIFTAPDDSSYGPSGIPNEKPSHDELQKNGAIWKLSIDDITKQHTLELIYSNRLDFTKYHPIPPSACTGRYESKEIKRIYWSDNYNKIRTINTSVPQLMALNPSQLSVFPKVEFTQPTLKSIGSGSLDYGSYQLAYKLIKVLGAETSYSELSLPVYLTANAESTAFHFYEGNVGGTSKSITWFLNNLDTSFDQVQPIVIYKATANAVPTILALPLRPILETMDITHSSITGLDQVTLEEFLLFNGAFTHAKTCDTKDNRLFWGNVRSPRKELESYDARAFRANDSGDILLKNSGTVSPYQLSNNLLPNYAGNISQTEDTINEYYDTNGNYSSNACYLKPSNLSKLGGEGINISYEFATYSILADNRFKIASSTDYDIDTVPDGTPGGTPFRTNANENGTIQLTDYIYPQNGKYSALKQPERTSLLKGFQHEEIYRIAFQAFDKQNVPYFTKWIADIKMPSYGDHNDNPDATAIAAGFNDFRLSYILGDTQYNQILCLKVTVNVTEIEDIIGGYQIVRVKRDGSNKTILGCGMINPFAANNLANVTGAILPASWETARAVFTNPFTLTPGPGRYYNPYPDQASVETLNSDFDVLNSPIARFKMFDCWDMDAGLRPSQQTGDKIRVREKLSCVNYNTSAGSYRAFYDVSNKGHSQGGQIIPPQGSMINSGYGATAYPDVIFLTKTNHDAGPVEPFHIMKMNSHTEYCNYTSFINTAPNPHDYTIDNGEYMGGNTSRVSNTGGYNIRNYGEDVYNTSYVFPLNTPTGNPCYGKGTLFLDLSTPIFTNGVYGCNTTDSDFKKLLGLYYRPNANLYGGDTYVDRTYNKYIPCSEYITTIKNDLNVNQNITFLNFGGDIFTGVYDMMKTVKAEGASFKTYEYEDLVPGVWTFLNFNNRLAKFSTSFFFPCTNVYNPEVRTGIHVNRTLGNDGGYGEDQYNYADYNSTENDTKTYFPKPLNFQSADEWINRVHWSDIKFNNETTDSWSNYPPLEFYDVEGNYGPINALISLKENMYYLQERGVGILMINPISMINDTTGQLVKLGTNTKVLEKHYYKAIDVGTSNQWSVYRSQSTISFIDIRHKKIYLFNGETVTPVSDTKGQRNFTIKRLHNELLKFDNPIINKGVLTTYDYYHNEFLYSFMNYKESDREFNYDTNNEKLTLAYSEIQDLFTGMYSFAPNLYINSNKYLISTNNVLPGINITNKLWFHNYGNYGSFYDVVSPSTIKLIVNDNPLQTKVFDNAVWNTESVRDNFEWSDDLNIYPGSTTVPTYPDDVNHQLDTFNAMRCYNDYQNTDWTTLTLSPPSNNITRKERNFNVQLPRNKFDYNTNLPSVSSLFDPSKLTRVLFGERLRDKYLIIDLTYDNTKNNRFILNNVKTIYRNSDR